MISRLVPVLLRLALGAVFIAASVPKILDPADFSRTVFRYELLPDGLVNLVAILLPWTELVVGVLLVLGRNVRGASLLATGSLVVFFVAMGSAMARGLKIDCGCFETSGSPLGPDRLLGDLVLIAVAVFIYRHAGAGRPAAGSSPAELAATGLKETS